MQPPKGVFLPSKNVQFSILIQSRDASCLCKTKSPSSPAETAGSARRSRSVWPGPGANIVIDYIADPAATDALEREIVALGEQAIGVDADVSRVDELQRLVDAAVAKFGRVDIMVNNAGVETRTSVLDTTEAQYDRVLSINLKSAFFGTQIAAKQMIKQGGGGRIINITSVHEDWPMPGNTAYCLSKGGMRMLTRTAGVELAPHGILRRRGGSGRGRDADQRLHDEGPGADGEVGRRNPPRPHGAAGGDRQCRGVSRRRRRELCRRRRRFSPTAA